MVRLGLDRAGWPFIGGALALAAGLGAALTWVAALPLLVLAAFFTFFFRDPDRHSPAGRNLVVSPADGRILVAGPANPDAAPPGQWQQVSVFLSPMDVHVNRMPVSGRVTSVTYTPGRFLPAYRHDAATANERSEVFIDHDGQVVVARQIVGFLARRVVCRARVGAEMATGERFGVMKFGSRMDVFLPLKATIRVTVGQTVRGGETVIAVLD
jgi:phosphatidylserine decarboxylase